MPTDPRELIRRVLELDEAATEGAWVWEYDAMWGGGAVAGNVEPIIETDNNVYGPLPDDRTLIAHYRTAAPQLARLLGKAMDVVEAGSILDALKDEGVFASATCEWQEDAWGQLKESLAAFRAALEEEHDA